MLLPGIRMLNPCALRKRSQIAALAGIVVAVGLLAGCAHEDKKLPPSRYTTLPPKEVPAFLNGTIFQQVDTANTEPFIVNSYGLVVNLSGPTGDSRNVPMNVKQFIIRQMVKNGIGSTRAIGESTQIQPEEMLKDPRNAIVRVDGPIPPGARRGQRFDVALSAIDAAGNETTSLAGGKLYRTDLQRNGAAAPGTLIDNEAYCEGPVFVNPEYALRDPHDPAARQSLRFGTIPGGGVAMKDRPIWLRLRAPGYRATRKVEERIDAYFQDPHVAAAYDEAIVQVYVPMSFKGDWEHFVGVVTHLYYNGAAAFCTSKAQELATEAMKPDAPLMDISYCWEGLGTYSLPVITPLMTNSSPDLAFAAARAAAFLGDSSALTVLSDIAHTNGHPFQVTAVQTLGALPSSPVVSQMLRGLLDSPQTTVRVEAYRVLTEAQDSSIYSKPIGGKFILDIVPGKGPPLIYATRRGQPRVAIFGAKPALNLPAAFSALDNRLTITSNEGERAVKIFYRDPAIVHPLPILSNPDAAEVIARLGGEGPDDGGQRLNFSYGEIVAVVQAMTQQSQMVSNGAPTQFVLQDLPRSKEEIDTAPVIPEQHEQGQQPRSRPQGDTTASQPQPIGEIPDHRAEARN